MSSSLETGSFLSCTDTQGLTILDARSPAEFAHAHIPGAFNLPLLSDEQRAQVGTTYKQQGRQAAITLGFKLVGPSFGAHIDTAKSLAPQQKIALYCARGGLRSNILSWVLSLAGFEVTLLQGGYKAYRQWVLHHLTSLPPVKVLGGKTGVGKTVILQELRAQGQQVVDLEGLAHHRGSAFGALGLEEQPSQEHFENVLAMTLQSLDLGRPVWMENESRLIGKLKLPDHIYATLRESPVFELHLPLAVRMERIWQEYGVFDQEQLVHCTLKIESKLGSERCRTAIQALKLGDHQSWLKEILGYYDKQYEKASDSRKPGSIFTFQFEDFEAKKIASVVADAI